jgi:hypothetical protein
MELDNEPGMFWWPYHNRRIGYLLDPEGRREIIRMTKPPEEIPIRLRWFRRVQGSLPEELVTAAQAYAQAWKVYEDTWDAHQQAWLVLDQARQQAWLVLDQARSIYCDQRYQAYHQAENAYEQAHLAHGQASWDFDHAQRAYSELLSVHEAKIDTLFAAECPGCPWNGTELVFAKG